MVKLEELLVENRGEEPVEILIPNEKGKQKVKIPFGIKLDKRLKESIEELLKGVC